MKISLRHQKIFLLSMFFFPTAALFAQLNITAVNTNHMITFDASLSGVNESVFDGSGFQATPSSGQLDSDAWSISGFSDGDLAFGGTQTTAETDSVLQLCFHDDAAGDGQPTQVSNIRVYASDHNTASWIDNIQGAQFYVFSTIISQII